MVNLIRNSFILFLLTIALWIASGPPTPVVASECTHYASPSGAGNGASASNPFTIADFWPRARAGYTLCLLDGKYTGATSMINPPPNLRGSRNLPITIRALNDGRVTIDGQAKNIPVRLQNNDFFILEGFNAHSSSNSVIDLLRSNNNTLRRVAAWDAADNNTNIFGVHRGTHNLLEDVAGWGIARKVFSTSQGGNYTVMRRAWGRWEGSHVTGPKMTYTLAYNSYNIICENCIGTWSGERMKQSYILLDYHGKPWTGSAAAGTYTNHRINHPYGIFSVDGFRRDDNKHSGTKLLGSIAYIRANDRFAPPRAVYIHNVDSFEIADMAVYIDPHSHSTMPFGLYNLKNATEHNLVARKLTVIGRGPSKIQSGWKQDSVKEGSSLSAVDDVFTSRNGANICYRFKDAVRTREPLWPWPMNQRIIDAMIESGRAPVNVTQTIEEMFGRIPAQCKNAG